MKSLANSTGGHMILTDSFTSSMYRQSFARVFDKDADDNLLMGRLRCRACAALLVLPPAQEEIPERLAEGAG